jgi:hypothetical protein
MSNYPATVTLGQPAANLSGRVLYGGVFELTDAVISSNASPSDNPPENAIDGLTYDWWEVPANSTLYIQAALSRAVSADAVGLYAHTLGSAGASFKVQRSFNGSSWADVTDQLGTSGDTSCSYKFASTLAQYWRVVVTTKGASALVGGIILTESMDFQRGFRGGFTSTYDGRMTESKTFKSERGQYLSGSVISEGVKGKINLTNLTPDWVRLSWIPFTDYLRFMQKPFLFSWEPGNHSTEVVLCYASGDIAAPSWSGVTYMQAKLDVEGQR